MSLITQCPACTTLFKVVPDQLRISEGWVRCGQCEEIFDANQQMVREETTVSVAPPESSSQHLDEYDSALDAIVLEPEPVPESGPVFATEPPLAVESHETADPILDKSPHELTHFSALAEVEPPAEIVADSLDEDPRQRVEPRLDHLLVDPPITFMPLKDPSITPSRFSSSVVLAILAGLLITTLVSQWLVKERDRLAAMDMGLQPVLNLVCGAIGCQVDPLRQIDAILIESSSFVKVRNDIFRLNFVLKSGVHVPLAMPAMELTLTDAQDQPVLRKVILASEFGVDSAIVSPGNDAVVSVPLSVKTASASERVAGYRLLAFYP